jgi:hypothetical protein
VHLEGRKSVRVDSWKRWEDQICNGKSEWKDPKKTCTAVVTVGSRRFTYSSYLVNMFSG